MYSSKRPQVSHAGRNGFCIPFLSVSYFQIDIWNLEIMIKVGFFQMDYMVENLKVCIRHVMPWRIEQEKCSTTVENMCS